jgi:hypothetical protein
MISSTTQSKTSNFCEQKWNIRTFLKQKLLSDKNYRRISWQAFQNHLKKQPGERLQIVGFFIFNPKSSFNIFSFPAWIYLPRLNTRFEYHSTRITINDFFLIWKTEFHSKIANSSSQIVKISPDHKLELYNSWILRFKGTKISPL